MKAQTNSHPANTARKSGLKRANQATVAHRTTTPRALRHRLAAPKHTDK